MFSVEPTNQVLTKNHFDASAKVLSSLMSIFCVVRAGWEMLHKKIKCVFVFMNGGMLLDYFKYDKFAFSLLVFCYAHCCASYI
mmetsp:Transcript_5017/g.7746  ORF Transcript_5017/g.7746 Transcript_5017/m.7746 type:complete len:83 (-) Transcript_5017:207-455(-)